MQQYEKRYDMRPFVSLLLVIVIMFSLLGCAGMTETQQRTLSGAAIGAAGGAGIAAIAGGSAGAGAAIGAAGGAITGYILGESNKSR